MTSTGDAVRPTLQALEDLAIKLPHIGIDLATLDHSLIQKAQALPEQYRAAEPERIRAIRDAHWYKVKTGHYRGGVVHLNSIPDGHTNAWWLGLAGVRKDDSPHDNFYDNLPSDSSDRFPTERDWKRAAAEAALAAVRASRELIRRTAFLSLTQGTALSFPLDDSMEVRARIRVESDGSCYLTLGGLGIVDYEHYLLILSAFPGISPSDWLPEPSDPVNIQPESGEIVYSTLFPQELQQALVQEFDNE